MKLDAQTAKYYYTAAQAGKALGLDEEAFQYYVRKGRIKRVNLPGRGQGVYSKKEVDRLVSKTEAAILAEQAEGTEFRKATLEDIEQEGQLANLAFGESARLYEERKTFLQKNPDIDYHLYDSDKLVAYITIVPLKHQTIMDYVEGKTKNLYNIDLDNIEQFAPNKPLECIIIDMVTTPAVPPRQRGAYGARLLSEFTRELTEMGRQGVEIAKIYATSRTPSGIRILKNAGFRVIHHDPKNDRYSFELDVMTSDEKILREYKASFNEWQEQQAITNGRKRRRNTLSKTKPEQEIPLKSK